MPPLGEISTTFDTAVRPRLRLGAAWAVHAFTASGVVIGLLALLAVVDGDPRAALLWLGLATVVDGLDGPAARKLGVREAIPRFDGAMLDNVVDYFTWVVVPAVFIYRFGLLPDSFALVGAAFILATSLYTFANLDLKTSDNYFVGFPAIWNVVAFQMFVLQTPPLVNLIVTAALGVLTFTPMKFVHPLRVREWRIPTMTATAVWALTSLWIVLIYPVESPTAFTLWAAASIYLGAICLRRSLRHD
jgi:phosphatidylcholine synthase